MKISPHRKAGEAKSFRPPGIRHTSQRHRSRRRACVRHIEEIDVMLPFFNLGSFGLFGIFFIINLIIQLLTGGLNDLFPAATM